MFWRHSTPDQGAILCPCLVNTYVKTLRHKLRNHGHFLQRVLILIWRLCKDDTCFDHERCKLVPVKRDVCSRFSEIGHCVIGSFFGRLLTSLCDINLELFAFWFSFGSNLSDSFRICQFLLCFDLHNGLSFFVKRTVSGWSLVFTLTVATFLWLLCHAVFNVMTFSTFWTPDDWTTIFGNMPIPLTLKAPDWIRNE